MTQARSWKTRVLTTDAEFRSFGNRVLRYEVDELLNALYLLTALRQSPAANRLANPLVESMAIHSRNLIEFLYFAKRFPSDVRARDYGVDWTTVWRTNPRGILANLYDRASKQVGHVTAGRLGIRRREKRYSPRATRKLLRDFRRFLAAAKRGPHPGRIGRRLAEVDGVIGQVLHP